MGSNRHACWNRNRLTRGRPRPIVRRAHGSAMTTRGTVYSASTEPRTSAASVAVVERRAMVTRRRLLWRRLLEGGVVEVHIRRGGEVADDAAPERLARSDRPDRDDHGEDD